MENAKMATLLTHTHTHTVSSNPLNDVKTVPSVKKGKRGAGPAQMFPLLHGLMYLFVFRSAFVPSALFVTVVCRVSKQRLLARQDCVPFPRHTRERDAVPANVCPKRIMNPGVISIRG